MLVRVTLCWSNNNGVQYNGKEIVEYFTRVVQNSDMYLCILCPGYALILCHQTLAKKKSFNSYFHI